MSTYARLLLSLMLIAGALIVLLPGCGSDDGGRDNTDPVVEETEVPTATPTDIPYVGVGVDGTYSIVTRDGVMIADDEAYLLVADNNGWIYEETQQLVQFCLPPDEEDSPNYVLLEVGELEDLAPPCSETSCASALTSEDLMGREKITPEEVDDWDCPRAEPGDLE